MCELLRLFCLAFHMIPVSKAVHFPKVQEPFDEEGCLLGRSQYGRPRGF